jgi:hypothetical protein
LELPDGETPTNKARGLWILRALQQTSFVSHMAWEICDNSGKATWSVCSYPEYRRLLDEAPMGVCQPYMETKLMNLPVGEGKEARGWLTSAHEDAECAREYIVSFIGRLEELRAGQGEEAQDNPFFLDQLSLEQAQEAAHQARL